MVGFAGALRALGAEVRVCAPPDFADLLARVGVPLVPAGQSVRDMVRQVFTGNTPPSAADLAAGVIAGQADAVAGAAEECDVLVAAGLTTAAAGAQAVGEKRGIRYLYAAYAPCYLPSPHYPPLGTHGALAPWPEPADFKVVQTGAWILPDERPLPEELEAFLDAGAPPVYVSFGSMPMRQAEEVAGAVVEAVRAQGRRVLLGTGWADLTLIDDQDDCLAVGEVNQQALFRRVAAVVHPGGAGTTTTTARAGAPQVVVPQVADQLYWAARVAEEGIGVAHDGPVPTAESLSAALGTALTPGTRARATAVAGTVPVGRTGDGPDARDARTSDRRGRHDPRRRGDGGREDASRRGRRLGLMGTR